VSHGSRAGGKWQAACNATEIKKQRACNQGRALPDFPGCSLVGPPRLQVPSDAICHQKSTCNSVGSSVGSLALCIAPPRATPRLGGAAVSCQYFPCSCLLALAPRAPALRLGVKSSLPLRASSRGPPPGAGALAGYRTRLRAVARRLFISSHDSKTRAGLSWRLQPRTGSPKLLPSPNEVGVRQ
jgi:hypothetical protein